MSRWCNTCHHSEYPSCDHNCIVCGKDFEELVKMVFEQQAEIEQWQEEANKYQTLWCEAVMDIQTEKVEVIKELANRLDNKCYFEGNINKFDIANAVKEMIKQIKE